jgi:predicted dehydrogenase
VRQDDRRLRAAGVHLFYAEELFFTPKYLKAKEMADQGAFGDVYLVKQSEMHFGPHADWFWDVDQSGGGVFMDMGCHGLAFCHWFSTVRARSRSRRRWAPTCTRTAPAARTTCSRPSSSKVAPSATSSQLGTSRGMDDRVEVYGSEGVTYANLHMGNALPTYSEKGYGYAVEKAPSTSGWSYPVYEELWNYGFPQELEHFARCVRGMEEPRATGHDGRVAQELLLAGYESAGSGRRVELPFRPGGVERPVDLWLKGDCGPRR